MKLRLHANTLRLRLNRAEVSALTSAGGLEESVTFAPGQSLTYSLSVSPSAAGVQATCLDSHIAIAIPASLANTWASGDDIGIEGATPAGPRIIIEKDFQCLHGDSAPDPEAYPNPNVRP